MSTVIRKAKRTIRRKPRPSARMTELLVGLRAGGITDFDTAWESAWSTMTAEKAWPHATPERREWKIALRGAKPEFRRCFNREPSTFSGHALMLLGSIDSAEEAVADDGVVIALALA